MKIDNLKITNPYINFGAMCYEKRHKNMIVSYLS